LEGKWLCYGLPFPVKTGDSSGDSVNANDRDGLQPPGYIQLDQVTASSPDKV